jgi:hypothetical protein
LSDSAWGCAGYLTEVRGINISVWAAKEGVIEHVEELRPELHVDPFGYVGVLQESGVRGADPWAVKETAVCISRNPNLFF